MTDTRPATQSLDCPTAGCIGKLRTRTSTKRSSGSIEKRRECTCCGYKEVAIVRPAEVIAIRVVVNTTVESPQIKNTH